MYNNDLISRSEVRKMIEYYNPVDVRNPDDFHYNEGKKALSEELLSELDNLSGVNIENLLPYPGMPEQGKPYGLPLSAIGIDVTK